MLTERSKLIWVYLISFLFIAVNTYMIVNHFIWGALAPVIMILLLLYLISIDRVILLITFLTPLAINYKSFEFGLGLSLPTEPLMLGVLVFFLIKLLHSGTYEGRILKHPLAIAILINMVWILFTSITSELPLVSFKFLASRLWFVIPFFFFIILMFKKKSNIRAFLWLYIISFIVVIIYTIIHHYIRGLNEVAGHWVMRPFYNDHTAYGAMLAMFIPVLFGFTIYRKYSVGLKVISSFVLVLFLIAIVLSYSRAAWLSLAGATGVLFLILLKIKFRWVLIFLSVLIGIFYTFKQPILDKLEKNKQGSSANFIEHVQSIANITTDPSNLERINRWQSAFRMIAERPFWGWGPGTYQFLYGPFQRSKEKTIISTNVGDAGNAHSEYIGPLVESGILGMLSILAVFIISIYTGIKVYKKSNSQEIKLIAMTVLMGLISYYIHGFLNNFLDSDKASVPVWGFMAILVALDIYHTTSKKEIPETIEVTKS
jgi:putative inorganic carbon (hco3(-)) transporter